jgi:hypothetical protein
MENYNALVEGDVREKVLPLIDEVVKLRMQQLFGFIPEFTTKFHPLRILNASEEEDVANKKQTRALNLYDRDLLSGQEVMESLQKDKLLNVESEVLTGARVPIGPMDANSEDAGEGKGEKAKPDAKKKDKAKDKKNSLSAFRELIQSAQVRRMNARKSAP